jgi:hypothetical protein
VVGAEGGPLRKEKAASGGGSGKTESDDDQFIASPESAVIASDENLVVIPNHLALDLSRVVDRGTMTGRLEACQGNFERPTA